MNKLMFSALAVTVAGGAFAAPLVYDYKASAKHMYAKEVSVRDNNRGVTEKVYQKYVKAATLKGYLIVDSDGATSQTIIAPQVNARWLNGTPATSANDFGRNRAFLVVQNSKAEKSVRFPKLLPAVLDAKWLEGKMSSKHTVRELSSSLLAEGYLYVGGDFSGNAGNLRPQLDLLAAGVAERTAPTLNQARMIGDYAWQSMWLFGMYNMPLIASDGAGGFASDAWVAAQTDIDRVEPIPTAYALRRPFFHDTWMNGSGFGKATTSSREYCCGFREAPGPVLQSLSGNLKGGLFLCTENGTRLVPHYFWWLQGVPEYWWEDQFFCARLNDNTGTWDAIDIDQTDLWQDGELELNTTDCISGTWSIKRCNKNIAMDVTAAELNRLGLALVAGWTEDAPGLFDLVSTIKGAALTLNKNATFTGASNIFDYTQAELARAELDASTVPVLTPAFAAYYGFLNFK